MQSHALIVPSRRPRALAAQFRRSIVVRRSRAA
jgi:hypothetical protein